MLLNLDVSQIEGNIWKIRHVHTSTRIEWSLVTTSFILSEMSPIPTTIPKLNEWIFFGFVLAVNQKR